VRSYKVPPYCCVNGFPKPLACPQCARDLSP
jgi:hypothetical protein